MPHTLCAGSHIKPVTRKDKLLLLIFLPELCIIVYVRVCVCVCVCVCVLGGGGGGGGGREGIRACMRMCLCLPITVCMIYFT